MSRLTVRRGAPAWLGSRVVADGPVTCRLDLVPAAATITREGVSESWPLTRVIVTADRIYIFRDGRPQPTLDYEARIESFEGRNTIGWTVVTATGETVMFRRGGGCACGSLLRSFRPFPEGLIQGPLV